MSLAPTELIAVPSKPPAPLPIPVNPVARKPAQVYTGPSVYYCPHCKAMLGTNPTKHCHHCQTSFPQAIKIVYDQPIDVSKLPSKGNVPGIRRTFRSPSGRLLVKKEGILEGSWHSGGGSFWLLPDGSIVKMEPLPHTPGDMSHHLFFTLHPDLFNTTKEELLNVHRASRDINLKKTIALAYSKGALRLIYFGGERALLVIGFQAYIDRHKDKLMAAAKEWRANTVEFAVADTSGEVPPSKFHRREIISTDGIVQETSDQLLVKKEGVEEMIECAIDIICEAEGQLLESEIDISKAKKAATFERWLVQAGIPFEKTVKEEMWLMGTTVHIEYYIEPLKHWGSATQVFFSLRLPGGASTFRRHTSEKVWGGHGKVRFTNPNSAIHWARMSREMYGHTDKSAEQTLDVLKTEAENPYKRAWLRFKKLAASRGFTEKVVGDDAFTRTRNPGAPMIKLLSVRQNKLQIYQTDVGRWEVDL